MKGTLFEEYNDPLTIALKHSFRYYGINIRPNREKIEEDIQSNMKIPLDAYIPSKIMPFGKNKMNFIYVFENIGFIVLDKDNKIISRPKSSEIDENIESEINISLEKIEDIILKYEKENWGELLLNRMFLSKFYQIIYDVLLKKYLKIDDFSTDFKDYIALLLDSEFLTKDPKNENIIIPHNNLISLAIKNPIQKVGNLVVGDLISKRSNIIKERFSIYSFITYVEMLKTYYLDTKIANELIEVNIYDLIERYMSNIAFKSKNVIDIKTLNLSKINIIFEMIEKKFFEYDPNQQTVKGKEKIYQEIIDNENIILPKMNIISAGI